MPAQSLFRTIVARSKEGRPCAHSCCGPRPRSNAACRVDFHGTVGEAGPMDALGGPSYARGVTPMSKRFFRQAPFLGAMGLALLGASCSIYDESLLVGVGGGSGAGGASDAGFAGMGGTGGAAGSGGSPSGGSSGSGGSAGKD